MNMLKKVALAFLIASFVFVFSGCAAMQYRTPARQRRRMYAIETDFYHMSDDIDWILGIERPSRLYDQTLR